MPEDVNQPLLEPQIRKWKSWCMVQMMYQMLTLGCCVSQTEWKCSEVPNFTRKTQLLRAAHGRKLKVNCPNISLFPLCWNFSDRERSLLSFVLEITGAVVETVNWFVVSLISQVVQVTEDPHIMRVSFKYHLTLRSFAVMKTILWICVKQVMFCNVKCIDILVVTCWSGNNWDTFKISKTNVGQRQGTYLLKIDVGVTTLFYVYYQIMWWAGTAQSV